METKTLDTITLDGMYMDIHSIEFKIDREKYDELVSKCEKILKDNDFLSSVTVNLFATSEIQAVEYYNSTVDDDERTDEVDSRIDTELLIITKYGICYRGYSKWTSDFLEVELTNI